MRVLVAMSGGVDSSVAAALMLRAGHEVVGATMKLWGGHSDSGCCSVADVEDARRVAQQLGIAHHVFNFTSDFERDVIGPYVAGHARATTPNPCIACNMHLKFGRFLDRGNLLGFDAIATGHHARVTAGEATWQLRRGRDLAKDQSYVLYMLGQPELSRLRLPIGELTKDEVRRMAGDLGLRTAAKPDSQDVCFITKTGGRERFIADRIPVRPGRLVTPEGDVLGPVGSLELVTIGQRRGLGLQPRTASRTPLCRRRRSPRTHRHRRYARRSARKGNRGGGHALDSCAPDFRYSYRGPVECPRPAPSGAMGGP